MGNQMFMYASSYSISKKLNRKLYIDDETAFLLIPTGLPSENAKIPDITKKPYKEVCNLL